MAAYSVGGPSALNAVARAYAEDLPVLAISGGTNSDVVETEALIARR